MHEVILNCLGGPITRIFVRGRKDSQREDTAITEGRARRGLRSEDVTLIDLKMNISQGM